MHSVPPSNLPDLVVDVWSEKIFTCALESKEAVGVNEALEDILKKAEIEPIAVASDKGTEFSVAAKEMKLKNTPWKFRRGNQKGMDRIAFHGHFLLFIVTFLTATSSRLSLYFRAAK